MHIVHHYEGAITLQQKGSIIAFSSNISLYIALQHGQNMEPYENSETRETILMKLVSLLTDSE